MPDAPDIVLCSKLCRHNPADPTTSTMRLDDDDSIMAHVP